MEGKDAVVEGDGPDIEVVFAPAEREVSMGRAGLRLSGH